MKRQNLTPQEIEKRKKDYGKKAYRLTLALLTGWKEYKEFYKEFKKEYKQPKIILEVVKQKNEFAYEVILRYLKVWKYDVNNFLPCDLNHWWESIVKIIEVYNKLANNCKELKELMLKNVEKGCWESLFIYNLVYIKDIHYIENDIINTAEYLQKNDIHIKNKVELFFIDSENELGIYGRLIENYNIEKNKELSKIFKIFNFLKENKEIFEQIVGKEINFVNKIKYISLKDYLDNIKKVVAKLEKGRYLLSSGVNKVFGDSFDRYSREIIENYISNTGGDCLGVVVSNLPDLSNIKKEVKKIVVCWNYKTYEVVPHYEFNETYDHSPSTATYREPCYDLFDNHIHRINLEDVILICADDYLFNNIEKYLIEEEFKWPFSNDLPQKRYFLDYKKIRKEKRKVLIFFKNESYGKYSLYFDGNTTYDLIGVIVPAYYSTAKIIPNYKYDKYDTMQNIVNLLWCPIFVKDKLFYNFINLGQCPKNLSIMLSNGEFIGNFGRDFSKLKKPNNVTYFFQAVKYLLGINDYKQYIVKIELNKILELLEEGVIKISNHVAELEAVSEKDIQNLINEIKPFFNINL